MKKRALAIGLLCAGVAIAAFRMKADQAAGPTGFRADVIGNLDYAAKELTQLAEAVPGEKYSWRPAAGVRSISEVYMHVALADYYLCSFLGAKPPEGISREMETKVTDKAQVVAELKKGIAYARSVIENTPDSDLDTMVKFFGRDLSKRAMMIVIVGHTHEHLGQSIAYARTNGVVPPWSEEAAPAKKAGGK
ncbi:MAG TPA: DinB family protein [Thermoanaerobaculia bacterium]|jgi:uncharacterized damage-inducible protein DinB